jgi:hypothetical protein
MGMGVLTFDWGQISYNFAPLVSPWWATVNIGLTIFFFYWIITPILYVRTPFLDPVLPLSLSLAVQERLV